MSEANLEGWWVNRSECARQKQTGRRELPPKRGCQGGRGALDGKTKQVERTTSSLDGNRRFQTSKACS